MDSFGNDEIARLLRLKRYEQPPPAYFENFLSEFRRRQRDEFLRQPLWRIYISRAQRFTVQYNVRSLASYAAGTAAAVACAAVISIMIYQQPQPAEVALQRTPIPDRPLDPQQKPNLAPSVVIPTLDFEPALFPRSRNIPAVLPANPLRSDKFIPLRLEWESLDDRPLLEK